MKLIHRIVTAWMLLFVFAFIFTFLVAEPYPTLTMPGFAKVFHAGDNRMSYEEPELTLHWRDGAPTQIEYHILFSELKMTGATAVMKNIFSSNQRTRTSVDTTATSFYQRMKRVRLQVQEYLLHERVVKNRATHPATIQWLKNRIQVLYPDRCAQGNIPLMLNVLWRARHYDLRDTTLVFLNESTTDSLSISLQTESRQ